MKRILLSVFLLSAAFLWTTTLAGAQDAEGLTPPTGYFKSYPLRGVSHEEVQSEAATGATVPLWQYNITSPIDSNSYSGVMVGRSPFNHGSRTTDIPVVIIPVTFNMPDGGVFDPTKPDPACSPSGSAMTLIEQSPIIQSTSFSMGGTSIGTAQYLDAFQRANFWSLVSPKGDRYHTALNPVDTTCCSAIINVPAGMGKTFDATQFQGGCGKIGVIDQRWWDPAVFGLAGDDPVQDLIAKFTEVSTNTLPIFVFYNVVMVEAAPTLANPCCTLGYHAAFGTPVQTYSPLDFDTTGLFAGSGDVSIFSHEITEWLDDPLGDNQTPAWGHIGQQTGCQDNLEVGDPLTGTSLPPLTLNGFTYHLQELAFFSWFFRQSPSLGVNGWFSDNGTFTAGAGAVCM